MGQVVENWEGLYSERKQMERLFRRRQKHQELVRFNVTVEIVSIEGLPAKYKQVFRFFDERQLEIARFLPRAALD